MRALAFAIAASLATVTAPAQSADTAPRHEQSRAGTVTNPPASGAAGAGTPAGEPGAAESRAPRPAAPHADGAVKQQAEAKRRAELEHCRTLTGESRADCVRRADAEYRRATSDDTMSGEREPGPSLG